MRLPWKDKSALRDLVVPRLRGHGRHPGLVEGPRAPTPPWPASDAGPAARLESLRFEHDGRIHGLHLRVHRDGTGLVVADAARIAPLDAAGVAKLGAWMKRRGEGATDTTDAASLERALWGEPVLTGSGPVSAFNAWESPLADGEVLPEIPLVASLDVDPAAGERCAARVARLAEMAIPHVVLRPVGESAAPLLLDCVRAAEDLGLVAGVAASADFVDDGTVLDDLAARGLDHLALLLAGADQATHDAVLGLGERDKLVRLAERAARLQIPLTGEVPFVASNWPAIPAILADAPELGMRGVTCWALVAADSSVAGAIAPAAMRQVATTLEHAADAATLPVTWAAPARTRDARRDALRGPRTDGDFGMRVLADGAILAPRGSAASAGNLDTAKWDDIAASPAWRAFLERASGTTRCASCPGLVACTTGCPAEEASWT